MNSTKECICHVKTDSIYIKDCMFEDEKQFRENYYLRTETEKGINLVLIDLYNHSIKVYKQNYNTNKMIAFKFYD